ncbi:5329_t:CDS:1 [Scutellospora calospora]|uniref:5329_t:CDS:1 n=1 Tax=Scutellospora calospora TaxID=85575 RepID=A0ACA9LIA2_9GLOM|nr:5329_t:CDS:1 [Scutellospora calospora]
MNYSIIHNDLIPKEIHERWKFFLINHPNFIQRYPGILNEYGSFQEVSFSPQERHVAIRKYINRDYSSAYKNFKKNRDYYWLGRLYQLGHGVSQNQEVAFIFYMLSTYIQSNQKGITSYVKCLIEKIGDDPEVSRKPEEMSESEKASYRRALKCLHLAIAGFNDSEEECLYGRVYLHGMLNVDKSLDDAQYHLISAANKGNEEAIGILIDYGWLDKNPKGKYLNSFPPVTSIIRKVKNKKKIEGLVK